MDGRFGYLSYIPIDIKKMLDPVEKHENLGENHWEFVAAHYKEWALSVGRPVRDVKSLRAKFDKLCSVNKPTGDPTCPPDVRRSKRILKVIWLVHLQ